MTYYEWDYETVDESGDITEHNHADKLETFGEDDKTDSLVLVRDSADEATGLDDRTWAYVKDGQLPESFSNAYGEPRTKVPQRFHKELKKYLAP